MAIPTLLHVLNNSKAKKSHRLVLIEIANHTNKDGLAWPSYRAIINKTGLSRRRIIDIVADLKALGELEVLPTGSPTGGQAYRIPGATIAPGLISSGAKNDMQGVQPLHPESINESYICRNGSNEEEEWLTPDEAVKLGLTKGSRMYRQAIGEVLPGE